MRLLDDIAIHDCDAQNVAESDCRASDNEWRQEKPATLSGNSSATKYARFLKKGG